MSRVLAQSRYLFEQIASVEDAGKQSVYSVRVDSPCHSFVANGFINHNTECRLTPLAMEMMEDIERDTVDFMPNYDQSGANRSCCRASSRTSSATAAKASRSA